MTLTGLQFISFVDFMIVMPLGPQLLADLGIDAKQFSWVVAAYTLSAGIAGFLVANVGVTEQQLPVVFIAGGLLTLVSTPLACRLVDRLGALAVFRGVVPLSAVMLLVLTHLPAVGIVGAALVAAVLMATNTARMVSAMSLITASIEPRYRGSFMSLTSSVQHVASGVGAMLGGMIVEGGAGEPVRHFGTVGILAAGATIASLWLAARMRPVAWWSFRRNRKPAAGQSTVGPENDGQR